MVTNVRMEVTHDLSELVQEIVFANGGCWIGDDVQEIKHTDKPYLYISQDKELAYSYLRLNDEMKEISAYDFIASQGQQKWLPKLGEECEFSHNGENWVKTRFKCYSPADIYAYLTSTSIKYKHCRPLQKSKTITIDGKDIEISLDSFEALKAQSCKGVSDESTRDIRRTCKTQSW